MTGRGNVELCASNSTKPNQIVLVTIWFGLVQFVAQNATFTMLKTKLQNRECCILCDKLCKRKLNSFSNYSV
jgi:hypothetical protein